MFDDCLVVFGGELSRAKYVNDVHLLNVTTWQWTQPLMLGKCPGPRQGAAVCMHGTLSPSQKYLVRLAIKGTKQAISIEEHTNRSSTWLCSQHGSIDGEWHIIICRRQDFCARRKG